VAYEDYWGKKLLEGFRTQLELEDEDLKRYFQKPIPEVLYHYSSTEKLKGILNTNVFWASNINDLNDRSEYQYGIDVIRRVLTSIDSSFNSNFIGLFIDQIDKFERDIGSIFILSLSTNGDSLPLWQAYSNLDGYNIGLDLHFVLNNTPPDILCHGHVIYSKEKQEQIINEKATDLYEFYKEFAPNCEKDEFNIIFGFIFTQVLNYITLFKHPAFEHENEYRFVYYVNGSTESRIKVTGQGKPYVEITTEILDYLSNELPLVEIRMGPKNVNNKEDVLSIFINNENTREINIFKSDIPLR